jgi:hypothetical protein
MGRTRAALAHALDL